MCPQICTGTRFQRDGGYQHSIIQNAGIQTLFNQNSDFERVLVSLYSTSVSLLQERREFRHYSTIKRDCKRVLISLHGTTMTLLKKRRKLRRVLVYVRY